MTSKSTSSSTTTIRPTHDSNGALLPAILCLHGGGSNATVFKIQARRLIWTLSKQFRFVFAEASIEGTPGFGMLPVFESCAPFYRWVTRRFVAGESDVEATPPDEVAALDATLRRVMDANGGIDSFKAVLGFSQGARLAAGLLLRQKIEERDFGSSQWKFAFGVMLGGPYPPIALPLSSSSSLSSSLLSDHAHGVGAGVDVDVNPADYALLKTVPSVHGWGRDDHVRSGCEELVKLFDADHCFSIQYDGGHHLPLKDQEAKDLCDLIMAAWYAAGGRFAVAADEKY